VTPMCLAPIVSKTAGDTYSVSGAPIRNGIWRINGQVIESQDGVWWNFTLCECFFSSSSVSFVQQLQID